MLGYVLCCQEQSKFGLHRILAQLVKRLTSGGRIGFKFRPISHCRATVELLHNGLLQFDIGLLFVLVVQVNWNLDAWLQLEVSKVLLSM